MTLASTADILTPAARDRRGVGAFNVVQLEHGQAIVAGAERADAPVSSRSARTRFATTAGSSRSPWRPSRSPGTRPCPWRSSSTMPGRRSWCTRRCGSASHR
jgi:Fructose-bisphosphate aldolase class-II